MIEIEVLNLLGEQVRSEPDPAIDISRQVCQRLRSRKVRPVDGKLAFASLGACSLAAVAMMATLLWTPASDSVTALAQLVTTGAEPELLQRLLEP